MFLRTIGIVSAILFATGASAQGYHGPGEQGGGYVYPSYNGGWSLSPYSAGISTYQAPPALTPPSEPVVVQPDTSYSDHLSRTIEDATAPLPPSTYDSNAVFSDFRRHLNDH